MRPTLIVLLPLCLVGCLDVAPKAGKLADVNAEINGLKSEVGKLTGVEASLNNKIEAKDNQLTAKLLEYQSTLSQQIGSVKGQVNTGMFSGGAVYVTVVCVTLILCLFGLVAYLLYNRSRWKGAFHALKDTIHEEGSESYRGLKNNLEVKLKGKGFGDLIDRP